MSDIVQAIWHTIGVALRTCGIWELNAILALSYTLWEHAVTVVTIVAFGALLLPAPVGPTVATSRVTSLGELGRMRADLSGQRPWLLGIGILAGLATLLAPAPAPVILALMAVAGVLAVWLDRFNPDALRWRVAGGLALYALASLAFLGYSRYLNALDAAAWAEALGGQGQAQTTLAQGRAFVNTLATWGLWLILPLGYLSLLAQTVLVHPPLRGGRPDEIIAAVRTRGQR
jgi:hypothetical protein